MQACCKEDQLLYRAGRRLVNSNGSSLANDTAWAESSAQLSLLAQFLTVVIMTDARDGDAGC